MTGKQLAKYKHSILYGISLAILLFLLKWLQYRFVIVDHALEIYIGAIAFIFTALGIWLALKLARPKIHTVIVEKEIYKTPAPAFTIDEDQLAKLGLSKRELEVLQLIAEGLSNQEIAARLFVSLNTIKTHSSRIFEKLDVKRRTQAIEKAKRLNLIP
jgi:DNA-binding CsgD family transcriptional regulator